MSCFVSLYKNDKHDFFYTMHMLEKKEDKHDFLGSWRVMNKGVYMNTMMNIVRFSSNDLWEMDFFRAELRGRERIGVVN